MLKLTLLPASLLLLMANVQGSEHNEYRICKAKEFVTFTEAVNGGNDFAGTTVVLDSDIVFTEEMSLDIEPIGKGTAKYFRGVFDGQGYTISNLSAYSYGQYAGLFGYSRGLTVRNVVLDSACSVTGVLDGSAFYGGGVLGFCDSYYGDCTVEGAVFAGSVHWEVLVSTKTVSAVHVGGVVGHLTTYDPLNPAQLNAAAVRDCAFYGRLTTASLTAGACVGGVAGYARGGAELTRVRVANSLAAGTLAVKDGGAKAVTIGGVVGLCGAYATVENCANSGDLADRAADTQHTIGGVAVLGDAAAGTAAVRHSFWTDATFAGTAGESSAPADSTALGEELATELSIYADAVWGAWLYNVDTNANVRTVTFHLAQGAPLALSKPLVLLPSLTDGWRHFVGWFADAQFTKKFTAQRVDADTALYGLWDRYLVALDANGGSAAQAYVEVAYGAKYPAIPDAARSKAEFGGWNTAADGSGEAVSSGAVCTRAFDHTLYAQWIIKRFYATFVISETVSEVKEVIYTDTVVYPTDPVMEGYRFIGWDKNVTEMPEHNVTISAVWEKVTVYVKVVMETGEVTKENIGYYFVKYTDDTFAIEYFNYDKHSGKTTVILRFTSTKKSMAFMEAMLEESDVESCNYVPTGSFSHMITPLSLSALLLFLISFSL